MAQKRLEELRLERLELRSNIEDFFSEEEPYYRDMLEMARQSEQHAHTFHQRQMDDPDKYFIKSDKLHFLSERNENCALAKSRSK